MSPTSPYEQVRTTGDITDFEHQRLCELAGMLPGVWRAASDLDDLGNRTVSLSDFSNCENELLMLVWREDGVINLGLAIGETYTPVGRHGEIGEAVQAILNAVSKLTTVSAWMKSEL